MSEKSSIWDKIPFLQKLKNIKLVTMMNVSKEVICTSAFPQIVVNNTLGEVLEQNNYRVLRIAETSKYPHVTHFIDGDKDVNYSKTETRIY